MTPILSRILRESEGFGVLELLSEQLSAPDLQSLLMEVACRRASHQDAAALLRAFEQNPYVQPSSVSPVEALKVDLAAFESAAEFEPVELSPLAPLGTCSAIASVSQNKVVSTGRNTEVVSDCTNVMALEAARRRRAATRTDIRICCSHRLVRPQERKGPLSFAHFKVFAMCSAGRDRGNFDFEFAELGRHIDSHLRLIQIYTARIGLQNIRVELTDLDGHSESKLIELNSRFADISKGVTSVLAPQRPTGRGYYKWACFGIYAEMPDGNDLFLSDGGFTDWTQKLLSNQKERLLISGIGTERICRVCQRQTASDGSDA